ncbi:membrane protein insertase YidC [Chitinivorax sp. B]|uniref:membrane protein insertase YidC n=1 Tax=Chitinivorax sp. B TaxID=2502235 RepID=UPI0010F8A8E1|nr:membrane protein insertase YidC [Chitinivorax sp. B]
METRRLIVFMVISVAILFGWQKFEESRRPPKPAVVANQTANTSASKPAEMSAADSAQLKSSGRLKVTTDVLQLEIDAQGGDIRQVALLKHGDVTDPKKPVTLLQDVKDRTYIAQTGLFADGMPNLPGPRTLFKLPGNEVKLPQGQDSVTVRLEAPELGGLKIAKLLTFKRGSYVIDVDYEITNGSTMPVTMSSYYRLLRDGQAPVGDPKMLYTFTGPAVYTEQKKFQKLEFSDIDKDKARDKYVASCDNGWIGIVQHYFTAVWLPASAKTPAESCDGKTELRYDIKKVGNLYSVGVIRDVAAIAPGQTFKTGVPLFVGPIETAMVAKLAPGLELTKDYGIFKVIASPLFWLLEKLHGLVGNWGWAIILLTVVVKAILYPLSAASYRSMAQMKAMAPRLERLKEQFGDDRQKFHQAMMELYKTEKINPLGGCLPMLLQMPIFMALYWVLVAAVELRHAPFMGWIIDLSATDPYFVWPLLLAGSMVVQTYMSPQPTDPMQAKMQRIMPIAFSVMFFFMPVGLVLYWLVNNLLTIAQQKFVEHQVEQAKKAAHA